METPMPVVTREERTELARIGGYSKWSAAADPATAAAAAKGKREARARLDALIARRHLNAAAEEFALARQQLVELGLVIQP
jgi:hypothetical protein